jgi:hypothetical protein
MQQMWPSIDNFWCMLFDILLFRLFNIRNMRSTTFTSTKGLLAVLHAFLWLLPQACHGYRFPAPLLRAAPARPRHAASFRAAAAAAFAGAPSAVCGIALRSRGVALGAAQGNKDDMKGLI